MLVYCRSLTMQGRPNLLLPNKESEVQLPNVAVIVDERVRVLLEQQVLQHAALGHQPAQQRAHADMVQQTHAGVVYTFRENRISRTMHAGSHWEEEKEAMRACEMKRFLAAQELGAQSSEVNPLRMK